MNNFKIEETDHKEHNSRIFKTITPARKKAIDKIMKELEFESLVSEFKLEWIKIQEADGKTVITLYPATGRIFINRTNYLEGISRSGYIDEIEITDLIEALYLMKYE